LVGHAVGGLGGGAGDELVGVDDWGVVNILTRGWGGGGEGDTHQLSKVLNFVYLRLAEF